MRRIGTLLVLALAGGLVGTLAPAASAGGWDSLEPQHDHYLPGQTAVLRGAFAVNRLKGTGRIEDGPYYAYLLAGSSLYGMIDPPRIPNGAIRLGVVRFGPVTEGDAGYRYSKGSVTFTVPDVASANYAVSFCNDPCRSSTIGWLGFGRITIVHTALEARLLDARDSLKSELRAARFHLRHNEKRIEVLDTGAREAAADQRSLQEQVRNLTERLAAARQTPDGPAIPAWAAILAIAALLALALAAAFAIRWRRSRAKVSHITSASPDPSIPFPRMKEDALRRH
jgi:hypothetical protein